MVKADTPTVNVTERNEQYCAPWILESPGGTVTTSPVAPALAPARGMIGRVLYAVASFLCLICTIDSQPTERVEGVGDDFVRGGQDKTPTQKNAITTSAPW